MREFFEAIWGEEEGFAEIREIDVASAIHQHFFPYPDNLDDIVDYIETGKDDNVFAGVLLRERRSGKNDDVKRNTSVLWADFDTKRFDDDRMKTFGAVGRIDIPPQIIVDSGHGFHTYWLLDGKMATEVAQRVMKSLAGMYGGDTVGDPARVMRVPGTFNVKTKPWQPVRLVRFNPLERTRIEDALDHLGTPLFEETWPVPRATYYPASGTVAARFEEELPVGERSELIFGLACAAIRAGWSDEEIAFALYTRPAGMKVQEMSDQNRMKWVRRTIRAAHEAVRLDR